MELDERIVVLEDQMRMVSTNLELARTLMERLIRNTEKETEELEKIQQDIRELLGYMTTEGDDAGE